MPRQDLGGGAAQDSCLLDGIHAARTELACGLEALVSILRGKAFQPRGKGPGTLLDRRLAGLLEHLLHSFAHDSGCYAARGKTLVR